MIMKEFMKENLKMIENMELVLRDLQINHIMKDYMLMENQKVTKYYLMRGKGKFIWPNGEKYEG
mgnify:CR=1 FL=1